MMAQEASQHPHSTHHRRLTLTDAARPVRPQGSVPFLRRRTGTLPPDLDPRLMPAEVPNPSHRHGTPSGPWPFLDLHVSIDPREILEPNIASKECRHRKYEGDEHCWCKYPQSLYPNWTPVQQRASRITEALKNKHGWRVYPLVVSHEGIFRSFPHLSGRHSEQDDFWRTFRVQEERVRGCHVHALFIANMAGPIMQMLGTKYNIEPFFFSSSFGWIPSQYQESPVPKKSDHITITLTFIRCINDPFNNLPTDDNASFQSTNDDDIKPQRNIAIKTNEFLWLESGQRILFSDILSLHMIRDPEKGHTIISYHAPQKFRATTAQELRDRFQLTGRSVYWSQIFARSKDPTFTFLSLLWYALYAWDESLEALYNHICDLESKVLENNDLDFTQELHRIRAHLLHYTSLLEDFRKAVQFVLDTPYPALDNREYFTKDECKDSKELMKKECNNLLHEIGRLEMARRMQDKRLTNVMHLGFSTVNILDSKRMHDLTEVAVRDSAAMKQIAYLTMFFLPASFVATAFGMNVQEINNGSTPTLGHYFAAALPLTAITVWIVVALQIQVQDARTTRRRTRIPNRSRPRRPEDFHSSPASITAPPGSEFRSAHTVAGGEIVIDMAEPGSAKGRTKDDSSLGGYDDDDNHDYGNAFDDDGYHTGNTYRYNQKSHSQQPSIWESLLWPISFTQEAFINWKEGRNKDKGHRRKATKAAKTGVQQEKDPNDSLPMHFDGGVKNRGAMTPAARFAADVRGGHSNHSSAKSADHGAHSTQPPLPPPQPPILLGGKEQAAERHPVSSGQPTSLTAPLDNVRHIDPEPGEARGPNESGIEQPGLGAAETTLATRSPS